MKRAIAVATSTTPLPVLVAAAGDRAGLRFLEFFAATLRNPNTRRAYSQAVAGFLDWCEREAGLRVLTAVQPLHVATWIELQTQSHSAPTAKQRLAALRHLFDWMVTGQVMETHPAASVRGPRHSALKGKTPVLDAAEARRLLDSIDVSTPAGLRDRALIALMVFSFARVGAATAMKVEDVFTQNRRLWVRLREKGGKRHEMPCHHTLEQYLHAYLDGTGIAGDPKGPLFRTIGRKTKQLTASPSVPRSATTASGRPVSPPTSRMVARLRTPRLWPIMLARARRNSMIGDATRSA